VKKLKQSAQEEELINTKLRPRFNAELGRQAEGEVPTLLELNAEEAWIFQSITLSAAQSQELE
jgi:hypothetical protein